LRNYPVFEICTVYVFAFDDAASPNILNDVQRAICRSRIGDEDFIRNGLQRLDAGADVSALILARDYCGKFSGHSRTQTYIENNAKLKREELAADGV
jgi:hypothetical protein